MAKLPKPLFLLDLQEKKVSYLNEAAKKMLGMEVDHFEPLKTFQRSYQVFDPISGKEISADQLPTTRMLKGQEVRGEEFIIRSPSGEFHIKVFSSVLQASTGGGIRNLGLILFQDITELKRKEFQLHETRDILNKAVEAAKIGFWQYEVETDKVTLSPILLEQFDIDPDRFKFTLQEAFQSIHEDDRDRVNYAIQKSIEERVAYHITYRVVHKNGEIRWIEANGAAVTEKDGRVSNFTGTTIDVTAEVRSRELIQSSKEAVEHERNNFRSLFRQTPEMVCILSGPEHLFVFVNEAHQKVLGFDATGKTVREAQPDSVEIFEILDNVYNTGETAFLIEIPVTVTGRLRYFNLTYAARRDLSDRIDGIMILGTEVTEEVLVRDGYRLQREALQLALNDAPMDEVLEVLAKMIERQVGGGVVASILLADKTGEHLLHGAAPGLPKEYNDMVHGIRIGMNVGSCGTAAFQKEPVVVENIEHDERWRDYKQIAMRFGLKSCWSTPILTAKGTLLGTVALYSRAPRAPTSREQEIIEIAGRTIALILGRQIEVKERVRSSAALRETDAELQFTLNNARMGTWKVDFQDGGKVTLSAKALEIFGVDRGYEIPDEAISDFIHPEDREHATSVLQRTIETGAPYEDSYRVLRKDGVVRWVELWGRVRHDDQGKLWMLTGLVIDITDRKRSEEQLRISTLEAERANAAKSQFLANMSHEIRTPLGAIMGFASLLKEDALGKDERDGFLSVIERNSSQLLRIIDDILDLSKVEAGMMQIENIEFSLVEMLADFSSLMGFKAREKGIFLTTKAVTDLPSMIKSDPTRLRQILINVVGNAIKFTDRGHVEIRICYRDGFLDFEIEDTGRGISKEQEGLLFQPFSQADASTTRKYGGTGLGLVLSRKLAEALGGHFVLKNSQLGVGSTFSVRVKASATANTEFVKGLGYESSPDRTTANSAQLAGLKVLLVEDSPDNQALISIYLNKAGATLEMASDGAEGFQMAMSRDYDVVLMDVQMPVMDGIQTVKKLRENGYEKCVVALTAHAMKEERIRCLQAGFTDFLSKPLRRDELIEVLKMQRARIRN